VINRADSILEENLDGLDALLEEFGTVPAVRIAGGRERALDQAASGLGAPLLQERESGRIHLTNVRVNVFANDSASSQFQCFNLRHSQLRTELADESVAAVECHAICPAETVASVENGEPLSGELSRFCRLRACTTKAGLEQLQDGKTRWIDQCGRKSRRLEISVRAFKSGHDTLERGFHHPHALSKAKPVYGNFRELK
jgi:hypothetical protein